MKVFRVKYTLQIYLTFKGLNKSQLILSDVNECSSSFPCKCSTTSSCKTTCKDTVGSFLCSCNTGFQLSNDKVTCIGEWIFKNYAHQKCLFNFLKLRWKTPKNKKSFFRVEFRFSLILVCIGCSNIETNIFCRINAY